MGGETCRRESPGTPLHFHNFYEAMQRNVTDVAMWPTKNQLTKINLHVLGMYSAYFGANNSFKN